MKQLAVTTLVGVIFLFSCGQRQDKPAADTAEKIVEKSAAPALETIMLEVDGIA